MKISAWWLVPVFVIGIMAAWLYIQFVYEPKETMSISKRKENDIVTFKLPNSVNAGIFGHKYWEAFHTLASLIPCSSCREHAIPLEIFKHDIVNLSLDKPVYDKDNWKKAVEHINKLDKKVS